VGGTASAYCFSVHLRIATEPSTYQLHQLPAGAVADAAKNKALSPRQWRQVKGTDGQMRKKISRAKTSYDKTISEAVNALLDDGRMTGKTVVEIMQVNELAEVGKIMHACSKCSCC
jgi:hypothetical protein